MTCPADAGQAFEEIAATACQQLLAEYGVTARLCGEQEPPVSPDFLVCSVISFSGREVRGTLVLALTADVPVRSNPVANPRGQGDWVGELSNQLLGRMKIELLRRGVEIYIHLPAVLRGQHLAPLPRVELKPIKFTSAAGAVAVWIEIETKPEFKMGQSVSDGAVGADTGDTLLFE
jgi:hypothetical protein